MSEMRKKIIKTQHGEIQTPAFFPDATYGSIKSVSWRDLENTKTDQVVTTTLHIESKLGSSYIRDFGGIHKFFGWNKPILTDSGGYQVFSLIFRNKDARNVITDAGCSFIDYQTGKYQFLSPEISQIVQFNLGADIVTTLDVPLRNDATKYEQMEAIKRNTAWAKRNKQEFLRLHNLTENDFNNPEIKRPLIGAVIQGGGNKDLRRQSVEELVEIGFDMYNLGGGTPMTNSSDWIQRDTSKLDYEIPGFVANLIPKDKIRYAMGIGTPDDIIELYKLGWDIFDTVLPTRNARHGNVYVSKGQGDQEFNSYDVLHLKRNQYKFDDQPIDANCDCECCTTVSRAYMRHLIRINEPSGFRLASIHNLKFYQKVISTLA